MLREQVCVLGAILISCIIFLPSCNEGIQLTGESGKDSKHQLQPNDVNIQDSAPNNGELSANDQFELEALPPEVIGGAHLTQTTLRCGRVTIASQPPRPLHE